MYSLHGTQLHIQYLEHGSGLACLQVEDQLGVLPAGVHGQDGGVQVRRLQNCITKRHQALRDTVNKNSVIGVLLVDVHLQNGCVQVSSFQHRLTKCHQRALCLQALTDRDLLTAALFRERL